MFIKKLCLILQILFVGFGAFNQAISQEDFEAELARAKALFDSAQFEPAKAIFSRLLQQHPKNAALHYYMGSCLYAQRHYETAQDHLEKAITLCDTCAQYHFMYGNLLFGLARDGNKLKMVGRVHKARAEMERVIALDANHLPARHMLVQFYLQAPGFLGGDKQKAQQLAEEMNRINPNHYLSLIAKIQILIHENKKPQALLILKDAADKYQTQKEKRQIGYLYNLLGYSYLKDKQCEQAKACFSNYILLAPDDPNAHDSLGEAYYLCGDLDAAILEYEKALSIDPNFENSKKMLHKIRQEKFK